MIYTFFYFQMALNAFFFTQNFALITQFCKNNSLNLNLLKFHMQKFVLRKLYIFVSNLGWRMQLINDII